MFVLHMKSADQQLKQSDDIEKRSSQKTVINKRKTNEKEKEKEKPFHNVKVEVQVHIYSTTAAGTTLYLLVDTSENFSTLCC